jgi:hypothetical protein
MHRKCDKRYRDIKIFNANATLRYDSKERIKRPNDYDNLTSLDTFEWLDLRIGTEAVDLKTSEQRILEVLFDEQESNQSFIKVYTAHQTSLISNETHSPICC